MDWLKDWGNKFNKAASRASFVEHLASLDKLEPALQKHLATNFSPPLTSSHGTFEKEVKSFIDKYFPERFASFREYQAASTFRKRMMENRVWEPFLKWCCEHIDFQAAASMDAGVIYKCCSAITRKFFQHKPDGSVEEGRYTWKNLATQLQNTGHGYGWVRSNILTKHSENANMT